MRAQGIVDQRDIGSGQFRQMLDFAEMVHAHFDHGKAMFRRQA